MSKEFRRQGGITLENITPLNPQLLRQKRKSRTNKTEYSNMKKTYSNPSLEVIKIATQHQMLAFSDQTTGTKFDTTGTTATMDARRGWFDDGDEEE